MEEKMQSSKATSINQNYGQDADMKDCYNYWIALAICVRVKLERPTKYIPIL